MFGDNYVVGTCYYPEHWDKSLWEEDLQRMLKAGITVIRIGEFAWSKIELFLLNYMFHEEIITLKKECVDLFTGEKKEGNVTLKPFEVLVVRVD